MKAPPLPCTATLAELIQKWAFTPTAPRKARQIHAVVLTTAHPHSPPFLNNLLISLYSKSGSLGDAASLFDTMPSRNQVSYNSIISAFSRTPSQAARSLQLLPEMGRFGFRPNGSTFASLLRASASLKDLLAGTAVHSRVVSCGFLSDGCVLTALLGLYSDCGELDLANRVFEELGERDAISWNVIIFANVKNGSVGTGLQMFRDMVKSCSSPTEFTLSIVLSVCRRLKDQRAGEMVHAEMIKSDFFVDVPLQNVLLDMYSSCGDLVAALAVFKEIEVPVLASWNSLISCFSDNGNVESAIDLFIRLISSDQIRPDDYTYAAIVSATAGLPAAFYGKPLHAQIEKIGLTTSIFVGSTLIGMYFDNQEPYSASKIFNSISNRDAIIWTEMIVGHSRSGEGETATRFFYNMMAEGHQVDSFSLSSALNSSADLAALKQGEIIHSQAVKTGHESDVCVSGSLIDMYAKNGSLQAAHSIFKNVKNRDLKCWNAMLGGYGNHGNAQHTFELFDGIIKSNLQPDHVTFVSLLSTCSHCCLVERGRFYWNFMVDKGIIPGQKHYACMVNLLSRTGLLQEAEELIIGSPFVDKFPELWKILLSSCVTFKEFRMGLHAAERIFKLEPNDGATYIKLSNLYASKGEWEAVSDIRRRIRGLMLDKDPGLSWIEIKDKFHIFSADDEYHTEVEDARVELQRLEWNMQGWDASDALLF